MALIIFCLPKLNKADYQGRFRSNAIQRLRLGRDREASRDLNRLLDEPGLASQTLCKYLLNPASHQGVETPRIF
jgi:hypothetical protein